jgi:citrate synthase
MKKFFEGFSPNAHPMAMLSAMVASFSTYYPDSRRRRLNIVRLLAKAEDDRRVLVQEVDRPAVHVPAATSCRTPGTSCT